MLNKTENCQKLAWTGNSYLADGLPLREYFRQVLGSQDVSQSGGSQEAGRVAVLKNKHFYFGETGKLRICLFTNL